MPFGYIGQNQTKQKVKNSGVLSSFDISLLSPISFFSSFATTEIVASGVPSECAAAAACPPKDSNSSSL